MRRVNVVGTSGSGKTTFGAELARRLGVAHVELDALSWEAGWVSAPPDVLRERVARAVEADAWVVDGNYGATRDLVWARADTVVWLDFPFALVMWRVIARTLRRSLRGDELWSGNRESLRLAFSRDSIILWALTTYRRRRRDYPAPVPAVSARALRSSAQSRPGPPLPGGYSPGSGCADPSAQSTCAATEAQFCCRSHEVRNTRPAMTTIVAASVSSTPRHVGSRYSLSTPRS